MPDFDSVIINGSVVFPDGVKRMDIGLKQGKITAITEDLSNSGTYIIDAEGLHIFPGAIDVHVHFNEPGREDWEGFETGSYMMAAGGASTFFDMPLNGIPSTINEQALRGKAEIGEQKSFVDFALWGGLVPGNETELEALADAGAIGFKAFLSTTGNKEFEACDDYTLLNGMKEIARLGKVLALHSESGPITDFLTKQKRMNGQTTADDYAETRPIIAEVEAVERAIYYADLTGCPLHFVHISSSEAMERIIKAKLKGLDITVETCAHYLLFNHSHLVERGAAAKCAPPLREAKEQQAMVQLLIDDQFDMITSDHSPCPYNLKDPSQFNLLEAWGGISGGQFTLLSMIELALEQKIPLEKVAEWTSSAPSRRFNLPFRGEIAKGNEASLTFVNIHDRFYVSPSNFHAKHKQSLFMNHTFPCRIERTINRGQTIYKHSELPGEANGKWLRPSY
ncbi:allantoinase AllB [Halobacillus sp. A5]|uniref:allantoinase AllB n=1 Tax=Halobacillus sp. A5 TaxID=2880263 RepID=UPI0020A6D642|nr:allantoinase AllB [Halobacillus sp. A5]MCP3028429.1 allantoinase AllB [Halobacillus sp. A5]